MATTVSKYVEKCQEIVDAKPAYKNGASSLTECDCIGMDKYAFRECGVSFSTSGTNYTIRNQVEDIHEVKSASDLSVGDVVFKFRKPGESGYDLPAKYKPGGNQYNGDTNDYYHIGTVKSVSPLQIIHMTTPTAKTDTKIGKWAVAAKWKPQFVKYGESMQSTATSYEPTPEPTPEPPQEKDTAVVWSENGKPVNMRKRSSKAAALVERIKCGETVEVLSEDGTWAKVEWHGRTGYIMEEFLIFDEDEPVEILYCVTIHDLPEKLAEEIANTYGGTIRKEGDADV